MFVADFVCCGGSSGCGYLVEVVYRSGIQLYKVCLGKLVPRQSLYGLKRHLRCLKIGEMLD